MAPTMYDYYKSQPRHMKHIVDNAGGLFDGFAAFYAETAPDRVYLCGSGTSFHAGNSAQDFMEMILGVEVGVMVPSQARAPRGGRPLVIAISQSGRSTNTLSAMRGMKENGAAIAALTCSPGSPVGLASDCPVTLDVGDELVSPKTKGYTGSVISLYLMALAAGLRSGAISSECYAKWLGDIAASAEAGEENQRACGEFYAKHAGALSGARSYLFVGKGISAKVCGEAALKVLETIYCPAAAYEFEEYLHGPIYYMDEGMALFLVVPEDEDKGRVVRLGEMVGEISPNVYLVTYDPGLKGERVIKLRAADGRYMSPFSAVFPGQLVSALVPASSGIGEHPIVRRLFDSMSIKTAPPPQA